MQKILLIGATSSVAKDLARIYRNAGATFFLIARSHDKLTELVAELGPCVQGTYCYDFCDYSMCPEAIDLAYRTSGWFDLIVLAHGYLGDQESSESEFDEALLQVSVNYLSVVAQLIALTRKIAAFKPSPVQIAVIGSVAGDRGRPRNYTYGSAKGALALYLQGLRSRLWNEVTITTIKLGPVDTPMTVNHEKNALFMTSQQAARGIANAISKKRGEVYVPSRFRFIMMVVKLLPERVFQKIGALSAR